MRCAPVLVLFLGIFGAISKSAVGSYESGPGYGVSHSSYGAAPVAHSPGWGSGHAAGSYYHYHVPLVGQQSHQHYQPQQQSHDHHLYYILPLLLLAALPLLLLPLLPLLLLPLGLSLLALLLPLLMMGGMMMMMMMMDGGMMMMMRNSATRNPHYSGDARNFGSLVISDLTALMSRYARSLDLDQCPERVSCEAGRFLFPGNVTEAETARTWMDFVVEQATPKGKARRLLRHYKRAFWTGSKIRTCAEFKCQPVFRLIVDTPAGGTMPSNSTSSSVGSYLDYYKFNNDQASQRDYNNYYYYSNSHSNNNTTFPSSWTGLATPAKSKIGGADLDLTGTN